MDSCPLCGGTFGGVCTAVAGHLVCVGCLDRACSLEALGRAVRATLSPPLTDSELSAATAVLLAFSGPMPVVRSSGPIPIPREPSGPLAVA